MQHFTADTLASALTLDEDARRTLLSGRPLVFAGTPEIAATVLRRLHAAGAEFAAVLTRPDAPVGRKRRLTPSAVALAAEELRLPVIRADRVDDEVTAQLTASGAELGVVVAYGALLPSPALEALPKGWVNLHFSALPAHRGAAPVQHTILAGDRVTAAAVFHVDTGMDTGAVHALCEHPVDPGVSAGDLLQQLTVLGADLLQVLLPDLLTGVSQPQPQQGEPSYAGKLSRADAFIDPQQDAEQVARRINATIPEPGAWTWHGTRRLKLGPVRRVDLSTPPEPSGTSLTSGTVMTVPADRIVDRDAAASTEAKQVVVMITADRSAVLLSTVQPEGKQMMDAGAWLRGQQEPVVLGEERG